MKGRPKILVVEDNFTTRMLIEHLLDLEGYDVTGVTDAPGAFAHMAYALPSLVILDVMLPGTDGYEVLKTIREDERTRDVPVLMLTALHDSDSTWKGWTGGCNYYMNKPFDTEDLLSVVSTLTSGAAA